MDAHYLQIINTALLLGVAIVTYLGNRATHRIVNSRMSEMLTMAKDASRAEGVKETQDAAAWARGNEADKKKGN